MQFIDSHCHLDFPELANNLPQVLDSMRANGVTHAICVGVDLIRFPAMLTLVGAHDNLFASVGVHPDYEIEQEPSVEQLVELAQHPKVVAIGETGLDYFRLKGDLEWQRERFRTHIRAARTCGKPLIVHTREAALDTLHIMEEEGAAHVGGVMHCFTESLEVAQRAIDLGFYISFSGIVTFKNAVALKEVAQSIPLDRVLIETDSPYLAPVPFRGKLNQPAYVRHVAQALADLRGMSLQEIGRITSGNFNRLFRVGVESTCKSEKQ
ncbi:MAG: TatD family hydrolase [Pseudomonadota bacterium]